jgi:DNA-binding transcriptional LysR family regulator
MQLANLQGGTMRGQPHVYNPVMHYTHISKSDLNLLPSLQVLIEERSISRAARRLFLSQSATSRILDRLQEMFRDELLVRTGKGYEPTKRALTIYAELEQLLRNTEELLRGREFNPSQANDEFHIAATNYAASWVFPRVMKVLSREAPHIRIHIASWDDVFAKLEANSLDLVLSAYQPPANLRAELIAREPFVCLVRTLHAIKTRRLTLERYLSQKHVAAAVDPARERIIDRTLEKLGQKREVQASVPFLSLGSIVEATNLIATLPQRSAQRLAQLSRTRIVNAPLEFDKFSYYQIWHPRNDNDPAHQWLRGTISKASTRVKVNGSAEVRK